MLEQAGLVRREVLGQAHRCHLERSPLREATAWLRRHASSRHQGPGDEVLDPIARILEGG